MNVVRISLSHWYSRTNNLKGYIKLKNNHQSIQEK
jgi:hypothetical protein